MTFRLWPPGKFACLFGQFALSNSLVVTPGVFASSFSTLDVLRQGPILPNRGSSALYRVCHFLVKTGIQPKKYPSPNIKNRTPCQLPAQ
ncbi:hypothetical protein BO70DRAFT_145069 [Aspergillus heteromorphus CBS 117.55]|uniref:Uncharacterized protein n=1 Tax=Aspergillus heteromorphus CBS 117.55 TaxID=1448321 RepID=A0A317V6P8_9EURO|nr:uncharacterized protein BO70DRAFT_145069 [Aspergillus heteromorphus CBS 117.55]PWY69725.1 hypothetical protein BO70DRAFT_145069 [Aspergillus heteromorphus CBS 117.55]